MSYRDDLPMPICPKCGANTGILVISKPMLFIQGVEQITTMECTTCGYIGELEQ